jgi:hypothetical protein
MVRVERHELRPHLLALEQIDRHELAVQTEVIEHGEDPAGIGRGREVVELHRDLVVIRRAPARHSLLLHNDRTPMPAESRAT